MVKRLQIVSFPELKERGDVTDWIELGNGKAELLARCADAPCARVSLDVINIGELLRGPPPSPREWLLGHVYCREYVSMLLGDGGVGKTSLEYARAIAVATGRDLTSERVWGRFRVLVLSLEDNAKELARRMFALAKHYHVDPSELDGWLFARAVGREVGRLLSLDARGRPEEGPLVSLLEETIRELQIDLVIADPFVKLHGIPENDNTGMDMVEQILTDLADRLGVAVSVPHHTVKGAPDPGNAHKGRGASAVNDAARIVYTITPMSEYEAERFGIEVEWRHSYIRVDKGKVNILPPARVAQWFQLVSVSIDNATDERPADYVQAVVPWTPPATVIEPETLRAIFNGFEAGMADGERYSNHGAAGDRAAWKWVAKIASGLNEAQCKDAVEGWVRAGYLRAGAYDSPARRKPLKGLFVAKLPSLAGPEGGKDATS